MKEENTQQITEETEGEKTDLHEHKKRRNKRRVQIVTVIVILALLTVATLVSIPLVKALRTEEGMDKLKETIDDALD